MAFVVSVEYCAGILKVHLQQIMHLGKQSKASVSSFKVDPIHLDQFLGSIKSGCNGL
jgi:hypothetical protein